MKYVEKIGGQDVEFPVLTVPQYEQVESQVRANRREELVRYLNECQLKGPERFVAMRDARPDAVTPAQVWAYLETADGARKVLKLSLTGSGASDERAAELVGKLDFLDAANLATSLVRFTKRVRPGQPPEAGEDPLP